MSLHTKMHKLLIKNLFNDYRVSTNANHAYTAIKSGCKYDNSHNYSLTNLFQKNDYKYIIGINNFCLFINHNLVNYIKNFLREPIDIVLPRDVEYPLQLVPFCIKVNKWTTNLILQYFRFQNNNLLKFLEQSNLLSSPNILYTDQWSSNTENSIILNLINYKIEDANQISKNYNQTLGVI